MERNEIDIFDELVRGKLANYTEAPEPEWIRSIQAKKTRAVNLYHLYRLMLIAVIVGAGIFAGIRLTPQQPLVRTQVSQPQQQQSSQAVSGKGVPAQVTPQTFGEFASSDNRASASVNASASTSRSRNTFTTATKQSRNVAESSTKQVTATQQNPAQQPATTPVNNVTAPVNNSITPAQQEQAPIQNKEVTDEPKNNKDELQTSSVPCKASFDYYTDYSGQFNFVQLTQLNDNATLNWDFGDGATASKNSVSHGYAYSGTYDVTLTVTDGKNTCSLTKNIVYRNPNDKTTPITLSGTVMAGSGILKNAPVELFRYDEEKGRFKSEQTFRTNQMGEYTLTLQRNARYLIKGHPTTDAQQYSATFWGNTTETEDASEIMVMPSEKESLLGYTIQLQYNEMEVATTIPSLPETLPGTQQVFLVDGNNKIVSVGTVDANGNYNFGPGIDAGDYKIINPNNGASGNTSITPSGTGSTGKLPDLAGPATPSTSEEVIVYPNPASSIVNFRVNNDQNEVATVVIMDAAGVERSRQQVVISSGSTEARYDISSFTPGIYYVMIFRNNKQVSSSRIVKLADSGKQ